MGSSELERLFRQLRSGNYKIKSPKDPNYNCIAWAAEWDTNQFWSPMYLHGYYWPRRLPRRNKLDVWIKLFGTFGYTTTQNRKLEKGFEKIAIYVGADDVPMHVARQTISGRWASKLGTLEDIEHDTLEALENSAYGRATTILSRPRKNPR